MLEILLITKKTGRASHAALGEVRRAGNSFCIERKPVCKRVVGVLGVREIKGICNEERAARGVAKYQPHSVRSPLPKRKIKMWVHGTYRDGMPRSQGDLQYRFQRGRCTRYSMKRTIGVLRRSYRGRKLYTSGSIGTCCTSRAGHEAMHSREHRAGEG